jgi:hypothetical protein
VAVAELVGAVGDGLLTLAVGTGGQLPTKSPRVAIYIPTPQWVAEIGHVLVGRGVDVAQAGGDDPFLSGWQR